MLAFLVYNFVWKILSPGGMPGPYRWPIIGNTLQMPRPYTWKWFGSLSDQYGNIFRVRLVTDDLVVISDHKIAEELLGRRGRNYASRKNMLYSSKYRSGNKRMLLMPYGPDFSKQRAAMNLLFRPETVALTKRHQRRQGLKLLIAFMDQPGEWREHMKQFSGGVALSIAFGMSIEQAHKRTPKLIANTTKLGEDIGIGAGLTEVFPILDTLPDFLAPWRVAGLKAHQEETKLFGKWANEAKQKQNDSSEVTSFVGQLWNHKTDLELSEVDIAYVGGSVGEAGTNTTQCTLCCFLYALFLWPDSVRAAQKELDEVVGDRLPDFSDFSSLPHVFAVVKEVLRWIPVTPLAVPHYVAENDEFQGYNIPASGLIVPSLWNMHRDPANFPSPDVFDPTRYYNPTSEGKLPGEASLLSGIWSFSFGQRSCPGKRMAVDSVWLIIAYILWAFDVGRDEAHPMAKLLTREDPFENIVWRDNVNIEPKYLPVTVKTRSKQREQLIREEWDILKNMQF